MDSSILKCKICTNQTERAILEEQEYDGRIIFEKKRANKNLP
jgi:hypothetical protein